MKQFIWALLGVVAQATQQCMYCRRQDLNAGFLVSYSYCEEKDECLKDAWNYISKGCDSGWRQGGSYDLSFCKPSDHDCPGFAPTVDNHQRYENSTWSLSQGEQCTVRIDATQSVARVIFDNTQELGIEYPLDIGKVLTVENGVLEIQIYNGADKGPLTFDVSFSGAAALASSMSLAAAGLLYSAF